MIHDVIIMIITEVAGHLAVEERCEGAGGRVHPSAPRSPSVQSPHRRFRLAGT